MVKGWQVAVGIAAVAVAAAGAVYVVLSKTAGGALALSISDPNLTQGSILDWSLAGATPNSLVQMSVLTNTGVQIILGGDVTTGAQGQFSGTFQVGTNIPLGSNILQAQDVATGKTVAATFVVS